MEQSQEPNGIKQIPQSHTASSAHSRHTPVLLAYRDPDHERMGRLYCDTLSKHFGLNGHLEVVGWKFEMLDGLGMDQLAATDAQQARLIVVTTTCGEELPDKLRTALACWCAQNRTNPCALIVLLSECAGYSEAHWPDFAFLEQQTRTAGLDLIVYASGLSPESANAFHLRQARRVTRDGLRVVEDFAESAALATPEAPDVNVRTPPPRDDPAQAPDFVLDQQENGGDRGTYSRVERHPRSIRAQRPRRGPGRRTSDQRPGSVRLKLRLCLR